MIPQPNYELNVRNIEGNYLKTFKWEYEGPINGIGTFCTPCAEDEVEVMELLKIDYLNIK